jgi:hypothetical protein
MAINLPNRCELNWRSFGRPLTGLAVAYALALQIFAAAAGFQLPTAGDDDPQFAAALCMHDAQGAPVSPSDAPDRACVQHCLFCFANINLALAAPDPSAARKIEFKAREISWRADESRLPPPPQYAAARPRGPPLSA